MIFIYRIIINIIFLVSPLIILYRLIKKKEDPIRFKEKLCFFSKKRIKGNLIWIHGASVGEILSVIPLVEKLEKDKRVNQILLTSNTISSSKILSSLKLKKTIHQFFPLDTNYNSNNEAQYIQLEILIKKFSGPKGNFYRDISFYEFNSKYLNNAVCELFCIKSVNISIMYSTGEIINY